MSEHTPRRIWWARPRKLCALERPGGGGRSHRPERRAAEIAYLLHSGVRLVVSTMRTRHNLADYERAGLEWHHVPVESVAEGAGALNELFRYCGGSSGGGERWPCTVTTGPTSSPPSAPPTCTRPSV